MGNTEESVGALIEAIHDLLARGLIDPRTAEAHERLANRRQSIIKQTSERSKIDELRRICDELTAALQSSATHKNDVRMHRINPPEAIAIADDDGEPDAP